MQGITPIEVKIKPRHTCEEMNCGKNFLTHQKYKLHMQNHALGKLHKEVLKCPKCDKEFSMFKSLHSHLLQNHQDTTDQDMKDLESKHAKCLTCGKMFRDEAVMKQHMKIKGHFNNGAVQQLLKKENNFLVVELASPSTSLSVI